MVKKIFPFCLLLLLSLQMQAQTAFSICLDEMREAYSSIDHHQLLESDKIARVDYRISYVITADPSGREVNARESWLITKGRSHHLSEDMHIYTDEEKAYNYRPHQFVVYCSNSSLGEEGIIKSLDAGIWDHCQVVSCEYTNEGAYQEGEATITPKEAMLIVDEAGQKKYHISSMTVVTDPVKKQLQRISLEYVGKTLYSRASYLFTDIQTDYQPETPLGTLDELFLDNDGKLKDGFSGCKLIDVRN